MAAKKEKFKKDRALRFYYDVLELDRLHYGLWEESDPRTIDGVKTAQKRYEDFLISKMEAIISDKTKAAILDVGCGSGVMSESLYKRGFDVEGLSPDLFQQEVFEKRLPGRFHLARFQNFMPTRKYDIVLMSESAQYIPVHKLFEKSRECLKENGYLMVCDYFKNDDATGPLGKSGHRLSQFLSLAAENGFTITEEKDITSQTTPTLDAARIFVEKYVMTSLDIAGDKIREKYPRTLRFLLWFFRKKIEKARQNLILLDSEEFARQKSYRYFLFSMNN